MPLASTISLETITSSERLEALAPEWDALWGRSPAATIFQSPHWLIPWWRHLGKGALCVLTLREHGESSRGEFQPPLRAVIPLHLVPGSDGLRRVMLLGTGPSDVQDALCDPGLESAVTEAVFNFLVDQRGRWDHVELHQLPPSSPLLAPAPPALAGEIIPQEPCQVLEIPAGRADLSGVVPPPMVKKLRYYERRALAAGDLRYERATPDTREALFSAFFDLHTSRWRALGQPGVMAGESLRRFHRESAARLDAAGALRLYALRLDERVAAVYYGFMHHRRATDYLSGFDPAMGHLSPGTLLIGHALREALAEGVDHFDFLRGRELYKTRWGASAQPFMRRHFHQ